MGRGEVHAENRERKPLLYKTMLIAHQRQAEPEEALVGFSPRPREVISSHFARGHVCLVATIKGVLGGFLWFAREYYDEDQVYCRFVLAEPESCVRDYDVHVEPHFRMGRTFARLWDEANQRSLILALSGVVPESRRSTGNPFSLTSA